MDWVNLVDIAGDAVKAGQMVTMRRVMMMAVWMAIWLHSGRYQPELIAATAGAMVVYLALQVWPMWREVVGRNFDPKFPWLHGLGQRELQMRRHPD